MLELIQSLGFSATDWGISIICALLIGMSKAGVTGAQLMAIPFMAVVFGGKPSTGIVLPMLIIADVFAVKHYNQFTNWKLVLKLIPWAFVGILIAMVVGNEVPDTAFKSIMAVVILVGAIFMIWQDIKNPATIPDYWWFTMVLGLAGGFSTMIGNAAGPVLTLYLLSMRIPKMNFIGTAAWFFMLVNLFKVPLHIFVWETITTKTLIFDLIMSPAIIIGVFTGISIIKLLPEKVFRLLLIGTTVVAAALLF